MYLKKKKPILIYFRKIIITLLLILRKNLKIIISLNLINTYQSCIIIILLLNLLFIHSYDIFHYHLQYWYTRDIH